MTVREITDFLSKYNEDISVTMIQCATDNPMTDDILINEIVAITRSSDEVPSLVMIPL